jgi:hypothetical protein
MEGLDFAVWYHRFISGQFFHLISLKKSKQEIFATPAMSAKLKVSPANQSLCSKTQVKYDR